MEIVSGSLLLSVLIVAFLFFLVNWGLRATRTTITKFGDIVRDGSGFPSLARFQFLFWTIIIMYAVLSVFFTRLFMGNPEIPIDIPENLLILMGISIAVPFVSMPLSGIKYGDRRPSKGTIDDADRRSLSTMLMENGKITVSRFQMFAWTWISIIVYLGYFFSHILTSDVNELSVPDIPQIFVFLMGLTQAGYVGTKAAIPEKMALTKISPTEGSIGATVTIYGTNFGKQKGKVLFETGPVNGDGKQTYVESDKIKWEENKIEVIVPERLDPGEYFIRVESNGFMTFKGGGQNEESKFTVVKKEEIGSEIESKEG